MSNKIKKLFESPIKLCKFSFCPFSVSSHKKTFFYIFYDMKRKVQGFFFDFSHFLIHCEKISQNENFVGYNWIYE